MQPHQIAILVVASIWSLNGVLWCIHHLMLASLIRRKAAAEAESVEIENRVQITNALYANMKTMNEDLIGMLREFRRAEQPSPTEVKPTPDQAAPAEVKPDPEPAAESAT